MDGWRRSQSAPVPDGLRQNARDRGYDKHLVLTAVDQLSEKAAEILRQNAGIVLPARFPPRLLERRPPLAGPATPSDGMVSPVTGGGVVCDFKAWSRRGRCKFRAEFHPQLPQKVLADPHAIALPRTPRGSPAVTAVLNDLGITRG